MTEKAQVLIVDDQPGMVRTTALVLERKGYVVDGAEDGQTAIERVQQTPFSVVLMDIKMPIMNGVETYKRIKAIRPGTAVIMMTAYAVEDLVAEALQEGAYAVIHKPFGLDELLRLLDEVIR
jgi:two-component system response regulator HydG